MAKLHELKAGVLQLANARLMGVRAKAKAVNYCLMKGIVTDDVRLSTLMAELEKWQDTVQEIKDTNNRGRLNSILRQIL